MVKQIFFYFMFLSFDRTEGWISQSVNPSDVLF